MILRAVDIAFLLFHGAFVLFILFGWVWPRARKVHLAACVLTAASWVGLGAVYGWGYCPLTDWHWAVRRELGDDTLPDSYLAFLLERTTGITVPGVWVDWAAVLGLAAAAGVSGWLLCRNRGEKIEKWVKTGLARSIGLPKRHSD